MTDAKLLLLYNNTLNHLTLCQKKWTQAQLKTISTKRVYKSCIFNVYVFRGFGIKQPNPTQPSQTFCLRKNFDIFATYRVIYQCNRVALFHHQSIWLGICEKGQFVKYW